MSCTLRDFPLKERLQVAFQQEGVQAQDVFEQLRDHGHSISRRTVFYWFDMTLEIVPKAQHYDALFDLYGARFRDTVFPTGKPKATVIRLSDKRRKRK